MYPIICVILVPSWSLFFYILCLWELSHTEGNPTFEFFSVSLHSPIKFLIKYRMLHVFINCAAAYFYVNNSSYPSWFALSDVFSSSICILLKLLNLSSLNCSLDMNKSLMWFYSL